VVVKEFCDNEDDDIDDFRWLSCRTNKNWKTNPRKETTMNRDLESEGDDGDVAGVVEEV